MKYSQVKTRARARGCFFARRSRLDRYVSRAFVALHTTVAAPAGQVDVVNQLAGPSVFLLSHGVSSKFSGRNQCGDPVSLLTPLFFHGSLSPLFPVLSPLILVSLVFPRAHPLSPPRRVRVITREAERHHRAATWCSSTVRYYY